MGLTSRQTQLHLTMTRLIATATACLTLTSAAAWAQTPPPTDAQAPPLDAAQEADAEEAEDEEEPEAFTPRLIPGVFYTPETSLAVALAFIAVWRDLDEPERPVDSAQLAAVYTLRQQIIAFARAQVFVGDAAQWRIEPRLVASIYPNRFYELGDRSAVDDFEDFNSRTILLGSNALRNVWSDLWIGPVAEMRLFQFTEVEEGGALDRGEVVGAEDHVQLPVGVTLLWDSRDHLQAPSAGWLTNLSGDVSREFGDQGYNYYRLRLDSRTYQSLPWDHVVALRGQIYHTGGDVPFNAMPFLGGSGGGSRGGLRGIFATRFTARNVWFGVAEYRAPIVWRLGAVAFISAGQARDDIRDFGPERIRVAGGGGIRFSILKRDRINLRLDYGVGPGEQQFYFNIREAF